MLVVLLVLSFVGCDQATKNIARRKLSNSAPVSLVGGLVELRYAENEGGFLSAGSKLPLAVRRAVHISLAAALLAGLILLLASANRISLSRMIAYSLILAGGIGNSVDRLCHHGRVVDFMFLGTANLHTGIFNVADVLITTGVLFLFISEFSRRPAAGQRGI